MVVDDSWKWTLPGWSVQNAMQRYFSAWEGHDFCRLGHLRKQGREENQATDSVHVSIRLLRELMIQRTAKGRPNLYCQCPLLADCSLAAARKSVVRRDPFPQHTGRPAALLLDGLSSGDSEGNPLFGIPDGLSLVLCLLQYQRLG